MNESHFFLFCSLVVQISLSSSTDQQYCSADLSPCDVKPESSKWVEGDNVETTETVDSPDLLPSAVIRARQGYTPCPDVTSDHSCKTCFDDQIAIDLKPWLLEGINENLVKTAKSKGVHYQVIGKKLYRQRDCLFPGRCEGVEHFINKVIKFLPDLELVVNIRDWPQVPCKSKTDKDCVETNLNQGDIAPVFSFSKEKRWYYDILYPAWSFWSGGPAIDKYPRGIGNWNLTRNLIIRNSIPWEDKLNITFFRGSRTSPERDPIILFSRNFPKLLNAKYTKNQAWRSTADTLGQEPAPTVTFEDQCKYKYLLNVRGVAASFRFKHLFLCKSLVLNLESDWIEFFYPFLKPWIHYIPVKDNFEDFNEITNFIQDHDELSRKIAEDGFELVWNHLTIESITCYWKRLLLKYSELLTYEPKLDPSLISIP